MRNITRKSKKQAFLLCLALAAILLAGSAAAYFTDREQVKNHLTIGKVDITLTEPKWDAVPEKEKQDITPNKKLIKDPKVTNVGINDAFVFVTVQVPVADVITANQDGSRNPKALTELYSWTVNSGWTRMGNAADIKNESNVVVAHEYKYVYGTESACTALAKGITTPELFSSVTFANVIEGEKMPDGTAREEAATDIDLKAFAIQTTDLTEKDVTDPANVWKIFETQNKS